MWSGHLTNGTELLTRVLWREGMHLTQHHFQAQGRFVEDTVAAALEQALTGAFGVTQLTLDEDAMRNGTANVRSARGIMPDGLPFSMPDADSVPAPRSLVDVFAPSAHSHVLHLVVRRFVPNGANVGAGGGRHRYRPEARTVADHVTGIDTATIEVARREFRLALDIELDADDVALPICRVVRRGSGRFGLDEEFIPPCLKISGSDRLVRLLVELVDKLEAKNAALTAERRAASNDIGNYAAHELAGFWMLHTIRSHLASLRHHLVSRECHPEKLYVELARLAGELSTFALTGSPLEAPVYDHAAPSASFPPLVALVRRNLDVIVPATVQRYPLVAERPRLHAVAVADPRAYWKASWIIGITLERQDAKRAARAAPLLKCAARNDLKGIVRRGLAALELTALHVVPAVVSPRPGTAYFELQRAGEWWEGVERAQELCVFVPDAVEGVSLELFVIQAD